MVDPAVILFANDAFYLAFNSRDIDGMSGLWARETPAVCIHPGWSPLFEREEIIRSWRDIFANDEARAQIECHEPTVLRQANTHAVICYERLAQGWLTATNLFVIEDDQPRIYHHQASHCANPPDIQEQEPASVQ